MILIYIMITVIVDVTVSIRRFNDIRLFFFAQTFIEMHQIGWANEQQQKNTGLRLKQVL